MTEAPSPMRSFLAKTRDHWAWKYQMLRHRYLDHFIFIHINKTGGSSVEQALGIPFEHKTASEKIEEVGRTVWDRKFTFAIIRNPWDKVVSHYHYRVQTNQTDLALRPLRFGEWVKRAYGDRDPAYFDQPKMFMPQFDWLTDRNGKMVVKFIGRFERLNDDFLAICQKLGKSATLPHVKTSKRGSYREYYDDESREIIARCFQPDCQTFGYRF